jgi:hypothetical protein
LIFARRQRIVDGMPVTRISTKEIRRDLKGFLWRLQQGQTIQVLYRSKPLVTVTARHIGDSSQAEDAGTPAAARRSVQLVRGLPIR